MQPHERVLELPGSSGRAAAYLAGQHDDLAFGSNFAFVADDLADRVLGGLSAGEARANRPELLTTAQLQQAIEAGRAYDRVIATTDHAPGADLARRLFAPEKLLRL